MLCCTAGGSAWAFLRIRFVLRVDRLWVSTTCCGDNEHAPTRHQPSLSPTPDMLWLTTALPPGVAFWPLPANRRCRLQLIQLDLFVMSRCPDARRCEERINEVLSVVHGITDVRTYYIADYKGPAITCKHGEDECAGDKQQLCAWYYAPGEASAGGAGACSRGKAFSACHSAPGPRYQLYMLERAACTCVVTAVSGGIQQVCAGRR